MTHDDHHQHKHHSGRKNKPIHQHWLTWVVVGLMLAAMMIYVFSDDESLQPGVPAGQGMPLDAPPVDAAP